MSDPASKTTKPSPGSDKAVTLGCTCPVMDNARGEGYMKSGEFWFTEGCPVHVPKAAPVPVEDPLDELAAQAQEFDMGYG